jgi:hypothetical protein
VALEAVLFERSAASEPRVALRTGTLPRLLVGSSGVLRLEEMVMERSALLVLPHRRLVSAIG